MPQIPPARVLLAHSYFLAYDVKQTRKMKPYPPLATLITASVLRGRGMDVSLFDAMLSAGEEEFERALTVHRPVIVGILEDNFNFLTKMCTTRMREAAFQMIGAARKAGCRVAVNGSDAADCIELYLAAGADAVILGETEVTFAELAAAWTVDPDASLEGIPGLAFASRRAAGVLARTPPRPFVEDLDSLPLPAWDLIDVPLYRTAWTESHGRLSWNIVTTRGCPFHCNWCAKPLYGTRYAQRSPAVVADELLRLSQSVAPDHVWFADDIFGLTPRWIESFCHEMAVRGLRLPFTMQSRVDLMTESAVAALSAAGAEEIWMGVESGSQRILDAMDKGTTVEKVRAATRLLRRHGIRAAWFLQLGYPGEEWDEILMTKELVRAEHPDDIGVSVSYPLPGTKFYEAVKGQLGEQTNWNDSDDLAMMFEGTFVGPFYKLVRDLLHEEAALGETAPASLPDIDERWRQLGTRLESFRSGRPTPVITGAVSPLSLPVLSK